jgi:hypothetical protein
VSERSGQADERNTVKDIGFARSVLSDCTRDHSDTDDRAGTYASDPTGEPQRSGSTGIGDRGSECVRTNDVVVRREDNARFGFVRLKALNDHLRQQQQRNGSGAGTGVRSGAANDSVRSAQGCAMRRGDARTSLMNIGLEDDDAAAAADEPPVSIGTAPPPP